jgi:hypothetical protein
MSTIKPPAASGLQERGVPADIWPDRLIDWMQLHKLLNLN